MILKLVLHYFIESFLNFTCTMLVLTFNYLDMNVFIKNISNLICKLCCTVWLNCNELIYSSLRNIGSHLLKLLEVIFLSRDDSDIVSFAIVYLLAAAFVYIPNIFLPTGERYLDLNHPPHDIQWYLMMLKCLQWMIWQWLAGQALVM